MFFILIFGIIDDYVFARCLDLDFLNSEVKLCYEPFIFDGLNRMNTCEDIEQAIGVFIRKDELQNLDSSFRDVIESLNLDDFGILYTAYYVSKEISNREMFVHSNVLYYCILAKYFDVKLVYDKVNEHYYVFGRFDKPIYGSYLTYNGYVYYSLDINEGYYCKGLNYNKLCISGKSINRSAKPIIIDPSSWYQSPLIVVSKNLNVEDKAAQFNFVAGCHVSNILKHLPQLKDFSAYLYLSEANKIVLEQSLLSSLQGRKDLDKVNILVKFVRQLNYGIAEHDITLFPDQTLTARVSDCEDRVLLLAALIKYFTNIIPKYIVLYDEPIPHAVLALKLSDSSLLGNIPYIVVNNEKVVLVEATSGDFEIGKTFEEYQNTQYKAFPLLSTR